MVRAMIGCLLGLMAVTQAWAALDWREVEGTKIPIPPAEHPRLYLRAEHAAQIPARLKDPLLQPAVDRLQQMAKRSPQSRVEWQSIQYLATRDEALGRKTIEETLRLLKECELPDRQDACRVTGRMMVTGAIVYDWHHGLMSAEQKRAFITELIRLAKTMETGYPPTKQGSVTGHASEAQIGRDMLSAGIAIYDEEPRMYELAAGRFFRDHLPVRNWIYNGHAYHQGDSYGPHRFSWDTFPLYIFDRLGAGNIYNPEQRHVPYYWRYITRPDGSRLRNGDTFAHSARRGRPWGEWFGTLLVASYYGDGVLMGQSLRQDANHGGDTIFEFLWRDTTIKPLPGDDLPLSRYFGGPFGWMVARTSWGDDAVIASMKVNEYNFSNHQHLDAGEFQVYHRGALAVDSGLYYGSSGQYGSEHNRNYFWRTISHNTLLIHDPAEKFREGYANDGGQRLPNNRSEPKNLEMLVDPARGYRTGKTLAHGFGPDAQMPAYTLLKGDITDSYSAKVNLVRRSFVFLNLNDARVPAALVVFDRVVSVDPAFRKYWLMHTLEEPKIVGASAIVDTTQYGAQGRLTLDVLWPPAGNAQLAKVGGPGREYEVFGTNYANDPDPARAESGSIETARWRIELAPKASAAEDLFLTVMQVTDRTNPARHAVQRIDADGRIGCTIETPAGPWSILFRRDGERSPAAVEFTNPGQGKGRMLITDLEPGQWTARHESGETRQIEVTAESGAAWIDGAAGKWLVRRQ